MGDPPIKISIQKNVDFGADSFQGKAALFLQLHA
jgi:hypothetical protein